MHFTNVFKRFSERFRRFSVSALENNGISRSQLQKSLIVRFSYINSKKLIKNFESSLLFITKAQNFGGIFLPSLRLMYGFSRRHEVYINPNLNWPQKGNQPQFYEHFLKKLQFFFDFSSIISINSLALWGWVRPRAPYI